MATTKQSSKAKTKKTGKKIESRFHAVRSLHKTRDNWIETAKDYSKKYITNPLGNSKEFVVEMKNHPQKIFGEFFDGGKGFVEDLQKDPKKVWKNLADSGKDLTGGARKDFLKIVENILDGGRDLYAGMEKDARKMLDDFLEKGKKITDSIPGKEAVEKGISRNLESIPDRLNLPSKKDMEKLSKTVRTLNTKLNTLSKQCAA
jgi:polyhydroxyalkanoate synthesis regulator phasin